MKIHVTATFKFRLFRLILLTAQAVAQSLPYNPTTILLPPSTADNKDIAYVFLPISETETLHQLVSLNISSTISQGNLSLNSISPNLPFTSDDSIAFLPTISSNGEISVYTGSCSTSSSSTLWKFTPTNTSSIGNGTWVQQSTTIANDVTAEDQPGANYLAASFSFSTLVHANASQTDIYIFGGMCPSSASSTLTWQSAANYSNSMLQLGPSTASSSSYTLDILSSSGPPIAEAGFSVTGLAPSYSNVSGVMTQQQNFLLLGGHTQTAFINMSQVAIWSLPEETWSFVGVDEPTASNGNTELAVKSTTTSVDSRSGHTAVLTEDGSKIIVFGGWVGDINQAADPQLAVLEPGSDYGGSGSWQWSIPSSQPSGSGTYGHGAVMLPGNVMMVLGGQNINSSSSKRAVPSTQAMFYNATSMSWSASYTNPSYAAAVASASNGSSSSYSTAKKVGLGVGLGLGLAAILIAILIFLWYSRKLTRRREEEREKRLGLHDEQQGFSYSRGYMVQRTGVFPWAQGGWNSNGRDRNGHFPDSGATPGYENLDTGVHALGDGSSIPYPPRQIPRKPLVSRPGAGLYQPMGFEFGNGGHGRTNSLGTAGPIHPIYEADEDDSASHGGDAVGVALGDPTVPKPSEPSRYSDPFKDPPTIVLPLMQNDGQSNRSPEEPETPAQEREREIQEWVTDWAAADALLSAQTRSHSHAGRVSPTRRAQLIAGSTVSSVSGEEDSGRTASNLSERSVAVSAMSVSRSGSSSQGRSRNNSLRGFISSAMSPFSGTILSTTVASTNMSPIFDGPGPHLSRYGERSFKPPGSSGSGSGSSGSFTTAHSSFPVLQAEGETLLPRPDNFHSGKYSPTRSVPDEPGSPSKCKTPTRHRGQTGWLGSIRRAFRGEHTGEMVSPVTPTFSSREGSPVHGEHGSGSEPRRAVSASAMLWRRKQGRSDWDDSTDAGTRSNTFTGDDPGILLPGSRAGTHDDDDDDEWDIERAVENRVVQVMFTVPREKLRVVNHDVSDDRSDAGSLKSKKGSDKSLRKAVVPPPLEEVGEPSAPQMEPPLSMPTPPPRVETPKGSPSRKGKVLEMVEDLERRHSPER